MKEIFDKLFEMTAFGELAADPGALFMLVVGFLLLIPRH